MEMMITVGTDWLRGMLGLSLKKISFQKVYSKVL
jgi:hypothetical protein